MTDYKKIDHQEQKKVHLLEAIMKGEREIIEGKGLDHSEVKKRARSWS